jgi:hypothetical protein
MALTLQHLLRKTMKYEHYKYTNNFQNLLLHSAKFYLEN